MGVCLEFISNYLKTTKQLSRLDLLGNNIGPDEGSDILSDILMENRSIEELNLKDKEFWNKLTLLKPDNDKFWSRISIKCGNDPVFLDPYNNPYDLIKESLIYLIR